MRKILFLLLLIVARPLCTTGQSNYDHKIIAVLPCRAMFAEYRNLNDSSREAFRSLEIKYGMQLQEALYKTITSDTSRLLVEIQPWHITDSILKRAGVDFLKIPYLDMSAIAKMLKVDACIVPTLRRASRPTTTVIGMGTPLVMAATAVATTAASAAMNKLMTGDKLLFIRLIDGKSGEPIWTFSDQVISDDLMLNKTDDLTFSPDLFKRFKKRFPYCD